MRINKDLLVKLQYELYELQDDGSEQLIEATTPEVPLTFIHSMGLMLPAFEAELVGLDEGDAFDFVLQPSDAYGELEEELFMTLEKEAFYVDGKFDSSIVYVGAQVPMLSSEGETVYGVVQSIDENGVEMDFNHPLAGSTLHFKGSVEMVKEPTPEEYSALFSPSCGGCSGCGHEHDEEDACTGHCHH